MMLSVGLVIGLGAVAFYLSKRALPRVVKAGGKEIHVLETTYLGPRKALHLVEVGRQRLLLASTSESVTMLARVPHAELGVGEGSPNPREGIWGPEPLDVPKQELGEAVQT
jgi:flagellar biosynthetic protein FliO